MTIYRKMFFCLVIGLLLKSPGVTGELQYTNLNVVIDDEVIIAPRNDEIDVYNMVIASDGTIWINTSTTDPGLLKSNDQGRSWTAVPVHLVDVPAPQHIAGFKPTRDGRLWIVHQAPPQAGGEIYSPDAFVSVSKDLGKSWKTTQVNFPNFAPTAPGDPYTMIEIAWCHPNLVERPDGTVMFSASMRYEDWSDYQQADQTRPGVRDIMIRTTDGGRSWGDPTMVHQHATETAYAIDPQDPDHILAATRIQRKTLPGEDPAEVLKKTGVPYPPKLDRYVYKNGLLLESTDGGRTFQEVPGSLLGFGSYRFTMLWTPQNMVVLVSLGGQEAGEKFFDNDHVCRISLDGGRTWADGSAGGTTQLNQAQEFSLVPAYRDIGKADHYSAAVAATVEISPNHFLTLCKYKRDKIVKGRFWHLENSH